MRFGRIEQRRESPSRILTLVETKRKGRRKGLSRTDEPGGRRVQEERQEGSGLLLGMPGEWSEGRTATNICLSPWLRRLANPPPRTAPTPTDIVHGQPWAGRIQKKFPGYEKISCRLALEPPRPFGDRVEAAADTIHRATDDTISARRSSRAARAKVDDLASERSPVASRTVPAAGPAPVRTRLIGRWRDRSARTS